MAEVTQNTVKRIYCERVGKTAALIEERVYAPPSIAEFGKPSFRVVSRQCDCGVECNLAGYRCKWSGLNPDYDPFQ